MSPSSLGLKSMQKNKLSMKQTKAACFMLVPYFAYSSTLAM
jgi:hypothetical protein